MSENGGKSGFTLIEVLMVIVIISILAGILLPALLSSREKARAQQKELGVRMIAAAILTYNQDKGEYPLPEPLLADGDGREYKDDNFKVVDVLTVSTNVVKYIEPGSFGRTANKSLKDPYGNCYKILFTNNRGVVSALVEGVEGLKNVRDY